MKVLKKSLFLIVIFVILLNVYSIFNKSFATYITVNSGMVSLDSNKYTYNGEKIKPTVIVKNVPKKYYKVTYSNNKNAGTGKVKVSFKYPYLGSVTKSFKINKAKINNCKFYKISDEQYTGKRIRPTPYIIANRVYGEELREGIDFSVSYTNNLNVGTAKVTIRGKGNYTGTYTYTFKITKVSIPEYYSNSYTKPTSGYFDYSYTGNPVKPKYTVTLRRGADRGEKTLKSGIDYNIKYYNNIKPGKATVIITGKGNYKGTVTIKNAFRIHDYKKELRVN